MSTYLLRNRLPDRANPPAPASATDAYDDIVAPIPRADLAAEVGRLPLDNLLLEQGACPLAFRITKNLHLLLLLPW